LRKNPKLSFKNMLTSNDYSDEVADELWKWCDFSEKKGVASF
jgi:hypothetical protein